MATAATPPAAGTLAVNPATRMQYTLGAQLGAGAFGVAFECRDLFDEQLVAKILKPRGYPESQNRQEWLKEVELMRLLRHPYVIHILDAFEQGGLHYLIMERAEQSLWDSLRRQGRYTAAQVVETARQLLSALHFIHSRNVVHRDLHIQNVLLSRAHGHNVVKVTDFGISKLVDSGPDHGLAAFTDIGRSYSVAPELVRSGYTTAQSDIYQLGLILYHLYTGEPAITPADGGFAQAILSGVARQRAEALNDQISRWIAVMLRRRDEYRFQSALDAWLAIGAGQGYAV